MRSRAFTLRRLLNGVIAAVLGLSWALFAATPAVAHTPPGEGGPEPILRIEEDWLLVLNEPNDAADSPQFHTTMSPFTNVDSYYAQVTWNHRYTPDFAPGGLQLHSWKGDEELHNRSVRTQSLSTSAETIIWTQALETDGVTLYFDIINGFSDTWGNFGRDMRISEQAYLADLSRYSTDVSVANSWITYGANRVDTLMILEVRYYSAHGLVDVDSTPRVVYELAEEQ